MPQCALNNLLEHCFLQKVLVSIRAGHDVGREYEKNCQESRGCTEQ